MAWAALVAGHVPTYSGGVENCFAITKDYKISQAVYLKSTGGIEVHCWESDCPFGFDEQLDFDAVFRDQVDLSTFSVYVGCGGCLGSVDPIVVAPFETVAWQPASIEPFTQHKYSSIFPKAVRKFNTSAIHPDFCDQGHWTLRLVDHHNRTDGSELVWSAVIGLGEVFSFVELLSFPIFVLRNHGDSWNEVGWSWWATLFFFAPLLIACIRWALRRCGVAVLESMPVTMERAEGARMPTLYWQRENPRAALYELAVIAFVAVMLEEFIHLNIAAQGTEPSHEYWVGLLAVILFANGLPLWQVLTAWAAMEYRKPEPEKGRWARFRYNYWTCCASPWWAPFELLFGFSYFLLFGAGFYVGPTLICLAALLRLGELRSRAQPDTPHTRYKVTFTPAPPAAETLSLLPSLLVKAL